MSRTTAVLLIVLTFTSEGDTADPETAKRGLCVCSAEKDFRSKGQTGNVSAASDRKEEFKWATSVPEREWVYIVVHHSATKQGSVEAIHKEHRNRKDSAGNNWLGIGYHFVIGNGAGMGDGAVEPTFRWRAQLHGAHSGSAVHNANGIGICLIGNFQQERPTARQVQALTDLIAQLNRRYNIGVRLIIGHNKVKPTACPGPLLPLKQIVSRALQKNVTANDVD